MECNICCENKKTLKCFHGCECYVCDDCIFKWTKVNSTVNYVCPYCKRESNFDFNILSKDPFGIYCITNSIRLLQKYSEKYKITPDPEFIDTISEDEDEIILLQPQHRINNPPGGTLNPLFVDLGNSVSIRTAYPFNSDTHIEPLPYTPNQEIVVSFTGEETNFLTGLDY